MGKYRKKPLEVEAVQWFPGKEVEGVRLAEAEIIYSADEECYYIRQGNQPARHWLGKRQLDGPVPEALKKDRMIGWMEFREWDRQPHRMNRTYHRKLLSFAFWSVDTGDRQPIATDDPRYLDYAATEKWEQRAEAYVITIHEQQAWLDPADWVITELDGKHHYPCKPDVFEMTYEQIEDEGE